MKRTGLKIVNIMGYYAVSAGSGYVIGRLIGLLFKGVLTEEVKKTKPVLFWSMYILMIAILTGSAVCYGLLQPFAKIFEKFDSKIDEFADDRDWD